MYQTDWTSHPRAGPCHGRRESLLEPVRPVTDAALHCCCCSSPRRRRSRRLLPCPNETAIFPSSNSAADLVPVHAIAIGMRKQTRGNKVATAKESAGTADADVNTCKWSKSCNACRQKQMQRRVAKLNRTPSIRAKTRRTARQPSHAEAARRSRRTHHPHPELTCRCLPALATCRAARQQPTQQAASPPSPPRPGGLLRDRDEARSRPAAGAKRHHRHTHVWVIISEMS